MVISKNANNDVNEIIALVGIFEKGPLAKNQPVSANRWEI